MSVSERLRKEALFHLQENSPRQLAFTRFNINFFYRCKGTNYFWRFYGYGSALFRIVPTCSNLFRIVLQ